MPLRYAVLAAALLVSTACAPAGNTVTEADLDIIRANHDTFVAAVKAGDFDAVAAMYEEQALVMAPNAAAYRGRMAWREALGQFPPIGEFSFSGAELTPLGGDAVLVTARYSMTLMPPGAPMAVSDSGKFLEVWRRQPDGRWLMGWDIWNTDLLPAPGA